MTRFLAVWAWMGAALLSMPVMAQGLAWDGYYVGASLGARFASNNWVTTSACPSVPICSGGIPGPDFAQPFNSTAVRLAGFGGRNWMLNSTWLAGVEAEIGWADNRNANGPIPGTTLSGGILPSVTNGDTASVNLSWDASLRARIGALVQPNTLLFATAGLALQRVEITGSCSNDGVTTFCTAPNGVPHYDVQSLILPGWTIGAGLEHLLAPNWLVRLEYRYADFGQANPILFSQNFGNGGDDRVFAHVYVRTHTANLGVAYKF
jgi:outer membrane immunogenic protein